MSLLPQVVGRLEREPWKLFRIAFCLVAAHNVPYLFDPPYWDAVMGVWQQGIWLRQHHWDFTGLLDEPGYFRGGSHFNVLYLQPVLVGALGEWLPPQWVAFVLHLLSIACGAACFTLGMRVLLDLVPRPTAWAFGIAALLHPTFSGQTAAVYVDIQVAFGVMATAYLLHVRSYRNALWCGLASFVLKSTVVLFGLAILAWLVLQAGLARFGAIKPERRAPWSLAWCGVGLVALFAGTLPSQSDATKTNAESGLMLLPWKLEYLAPLTTVVTLATLAAALVLLARRDARARVVDSVWGVPALFAILIAGFWVSFAVLPISLVRYTTMIIFPTLILAGYVAHSVAPRAAPWVGSALAIGCLLGQWGIGFPELPAVYARSGEFLERNRLWLEDQRANVALARRVDEYLGAQPILTKFPHTQMLCSPELGFVRTRPRRLYALGAVPTTCPGVTLLNPARDPIPEGALYVWAQTNLQFAFPPVLRPAPNAEVLWEDRGLGGRLGIYRLVPMGNDVSR